MISASLPAAPAKLSQMDLCWNQGDGAHANIRIRRPDGTVKVMGLTVERPNAARAPDANAKNPGMRGVVLNADNQISNAEVMELGSLTPEAEAAVLQAEQLAMRQAASRDIVYAASAHPRMPRGAMNCVGYAARILEAASREPVRGLEAGTIDELIEAGYQARRGMRPQSAL